MDGQRSGLTGGAALLRPCPREGRCREGGWFYRRFEGGCGRMVWGRQVAGKRRAWMRKVETRKAFCLFAWAKETDNGMVP